ncbi:MAG: radical SAM protein [Bacteroidota bacterium]|nr:radical SAM protein [Bacteroidota bacterium]MDP4234419.1 radical SAM protein [Bacteroidota bacterium]MDP4288151.1 radical SAM protein [Bacteroidota bacterium]
MPSNYSPLPLESPLLAVEPEVDHRKLYRLPWNLADNAISWLEPTSQCNLACDGCYRENVTKSHKPLEQVREEIDTFLRLRNSDGISIAGGEPLMHPDIVEIVRHVAKRGVKPVINSNGGLLTKDLLHELKMAGATGFTFHIDSKQGRPGWKHANELQLNDLRMHFADMLADEGGLSCSFNATVYDDTLHYAPELVEWAGKNIDKVHVMVFILYRAAAPQIPFDWYAGAKKVDMNDLVYGETQERKVDLQATDVVHEIRRRFPEFNPCAYLNGTEKPDSFKWLLSGRIGTKEKVYGYVGARFMEINQAGYHFLKGRYLGYASPGTTKLGRSMMLLSPFDKGARKVAGAYAKSALHNPARLFKGMHYQSIMIIQPVDFLENGQQNMCDGCPDMTLHNGQLVWSCRMEELKQFGCWVRTVPKSNLTQIEAPSEN